MKDRWGREESQLNQVGTLLIIIPPLLAAFLVAGVIPFNVPVPLLLIVVVICGLVGGTLNLVGRGPLVLGTIMGLVLTLGGFSAVYAWTQVRQGVFWHELEVAAAFFIGTIPGFLLQRLFQHMVAGRTKAGN